MKKFSLIFHLTLLSLMILSVFSPIRAQQDKEDKREAQLRTVHGSVLDSSQAPVASSVVYLKNMRTQAVKTHITDDAGAYRFSGLDPNADYQIHAEHGEMVSADRTVSSFDSRKDMEIILKLQKKKT